MFRQSIAFSIALLGLLLVPGVTSADDRVHVEVDPEQINLETPQLEAGIRISGYVSGVYRQTFLDKKTGFRDAGFGLDIVDWIMEDGSDEKYRDQLDEELVYHFGNLYHGKTAKRSIEGPQICTRAKRLTPRLILGPDLAAVRQQYKYHTAAPGKKTGSLWEQTIVFPKGKRYFISCDQVTTVNSSEGLFQRIDMPGHIKHEQGDTFSEIYLSYLPQTNTPELGKEGRIPSSQFYENFAPDEKFNYRRDRARQTPERFIRAYRLRDPQTGKSGPWLAGMTLDPGVVSEAWCHQRGYVCMIQEYGGRPIKAGETFSAAFIVGYFDSIEEMHQVYDQHKGHTRLEISATDWILLP